MNNCILLRYGEVGLKSHRVRPYFEKLYVKAIRNALERNGIDEFKIKNLGGRFIVYCENPDYACEILKKVAGVQSLSPGRSIKFSNKKKIIKESKSFASLVKGKTFGVKVKRIGNHKFDSMSLAKEIGDNIYEHSKGVDLRSPEVWIYVEVRDKEAFFYSSIIKGIGGLPTGSSEKVLALFSGGIDSPVAALEMIKRGCKVDFLFVNIMGEKLLHDVSKVYNFLIANYAFGYTPKLYVVDGTNLVEYTKKHVPDSMRQLAYKIILYKIGARVAKKNKHLCLVSGEALAQKSSQTLKSLLFIENQTKSTMLRPLLTFDKVDIMAIARSIGTLSSSEKIKEYCNLSEGAVSTSPRESDIRKISIPEDDIKKASDGVFIHKGLIYLDEAPKSELLKSTIKDLVMVDMRSALFQEKAPLNVDINMLYSNAFEKIQDFKKGKKYVIICEYGVRSEDFAFQLRKKGINATGVSTQNYIKYFSRLKKGRV